MSKLRLCSIGTSMITGLALDAFSKSDDYEIVAFYSRSKVKAQAFVDRYQVNRVITDFEELKNAQDIDVVYVASPNGLHFSQSLELIEANKHVITEKPYVANLKEFEILQAAVKKHQKFCFDAIMPIHLPNFHLIKEKLELIKPIHMMNSSQVQYSSRYDALLKGDIANIFDPKFAGGALMDLGVYPITVSIALFGKPNDIEYQARRHENGIDLSGVITLKYDDMVSVCCVGKDAQAENNTIIMGEKGSLTSHGSASTLKDCILTQNRKSEDISCVQFENQMMHEMQDFAQVINSNDWKQYDAWMAITKEVISIMEIARKQIGLVFQND